MIASGAGGSKHEHPLRLFVVRPILLDRLVAPNLRSTIVFAGIQLEREREEYAAPKQDLWVCDSRRHSGCAYEAGADNYKGEPRDGREGPGRLTKSEAIQGLRIRLAYCGTGAKQKAPSGECDVVW